MLLTLPKWAAVGPARAVARPRTLPAVGVRVRADSGERLAADPDRFALQVLAPDHLPGALAAMRLFRVDVVGLSGKGNRPSTDTGRAPTARDRAEVSQVVPAPAGPLLLVEHLDAAPEELARVPGLLARRLEDAGVGDATVVVPDLGGRLDVLDRTPGCVVLRLFPMPADGAAIPPDWLDVAVDWIAGDLADHDPVVARILAVEQEVPAPAAATLLHECGVARAWCDLVNGDPADRLRTVSLTYGRLPHLALAAGGPGLDAAGLLARFELLQDVARELAADVAYACLDIEPTFEGLGLGLPVDGWRARGGAAPNRVAAVVGDLVVPDAFPWQVLGPGHLARFAAGGVGPPPHEQLGDGRVEVALGEPADWLPRSSTRLEVQEDALGWLTPLLVDDDELAELEASRPLPTARRPFHGGSRAPASPTAAAAPPPEPQGLPDLDAVVLRSGPSSRRSIRLSPLELAAWFAHEPHSDHPASVSPVLATFVRWWAGGLEGDDLQRLKPLVPCIVDTAGDAEADRARRWLAVDWLVRRQAAGWLRLAGLGEAAERLAAAGPLTDERELATAIEVLGGAITLAGRRFDITTSLVGGEHDHHHDDPDEALAWETWEAVTEPTAWVAASEAATHGAPGEVAYATDLRVIECSRDPKVRDALEAAGVTVGSTAWKTAVHALADEIWERAWRAADRAAREASGLTIRVEMGRVAKTTLARPGWAGVSQREELPEVALEQAEAAARDTLMRAALRAGDPDHGSDLPWDAARNAARSSPGGATWSVVIDESRRAVGEAAWAQSMADAGVVVDELLHDAPDVLARAVTAAIAREASSAAARGVAYRAAAVARAHGADDQGAEEAARQSLAGCAAELQASAFELLDQLITTKS